MAIGAATENAPLLFPFKLVYGNNSSAHLPPPMETVWHQQSGHSRSAFFSSSASTEKPLSKTGSGDSQSQHIASPDPKHSFQQLNISRGTAAVHRVSYGQSSSAVRAWRFPSSRRFLWDRTATGPCIHLHPQVPDKFNSFEALALGINIHWHA